MFAASRSSLSVYHVAFLTEPLVVDTSSDLMARLVAVVVFATNDEQSLTRYFPRATVLARDGPTHS